MMHAGALRTLMASAILYGWSSSAALSAQGSDPDWPCIQRKVPELSIGQIWTGPELPETSGADSEISALIGELAARRVPLAEAEQKIQNFAQDLTREERQDQLSKLMRSLFDHMNLERSQVIAGIGRYAQKQRDLAAALRHEASAIDALRANSQNPSEVAIRNDQLMLRTRIFQERVQSLSFVCEVPTLIEQRLYALAKAISQTLENP